MPNPNEYNNEEEFMSACISTAAGEGKEQDQAVAMCKNMWAEKKQKQGIEFKSYPMDIQGIEGRTVKSLFAVMGHVDDGGDRILPSAFKKTLGERQSRVQVLWQHDSSQPPVGKPLSIKEIGAAELPGEYKTQYPTATGALYGEVEYLDTPRGNEILTGIRAGAIKENSIGYDTIQADYATEGERKVRNLREVRLWDISPVNWGMQPAAINLKSAVMRFHVGELDIPGLIPELMRVFTGEAKEGRMLSAANLGKLKQALETLTSILLAAEPPEDEVFIKALTERMRARIRIAENEIYGGI